MALRDVGKKEIESTNRRVEEVVGKNLKARMSRPGKHGEVSAVEEKEGRDLTVRSSDKLSNIFPQGRRYKIQ